VLTGFMGVGKSSVARHLSMLLGCERVDLDTFIEEHERRKIHEIIDKDGLEFYREVESRNLERALTETNAQIFSLGGGTWTNPANRTLVALHDCLTVWLDVPFEVCWQRISEGTGAVRPLAPDYQTAHSRYESRRPLYALAERPVTVSADDSVERIVEQITGQS